MLRKTLLSFILLGMSGVLLAQQAKLHIQAIPDQSVVLLNGDTLGPANDRTVYLGFNERKGIDTHTIVVAAPGYIPFERSYSIDAPRDNAINVRLPRVLPSLDQKPVERIDWRVVASGIPYGTELGAGTRWLYRFNKDVLDVQAKDELHQALAAMNLNLFDSLPDARVRMEQGDSARLILQGLVESYTLKRGLRSENYASYYKAYTASVSVRWSLIDRTTDSILLDQPYASVYEYRGIATIGFHDAVVDNFYRFAQSDSSMLALINTLDKPRPTEEIGRFEEAEGDGDTSLDSWGQVVEQVSMDSAVTNGSLAIEVNSMQHPTPDSTSPARQPLDQPHQDTIRQIQLDVVHTRGPDADDRIAGTDATFRFIPRPTLEMNERYARSTLVGMMDEQGQVEALGVVLSKNGLVVIPRLLKKNQVLRLRFSNGVELDAQVEAVDAGTQLSLLKINARSLKAALASDAGRAEAQKVLLPSFESDSKVGLHWEDCSIPAWMDCVRGQGLSVTSVFSSRYAWMGFQRSEGDFLDATSILNVFNIAYE
jgi:hypothetical protein